MGLANEIMREIRDLEKDGNSGFKAPYSDLQMLGKFHTTVGSFMNKYIGRSWTGRGDVLVPSHNMCMIYEDEEGNTHMKNDSRILPDGTKVPIRQYLRNLI
jgi:hypothetical protein